MASNISQQIAKLRYKLVMSQSDFGRLFKTTAMTVSRWERGVNQPDASALLKLGLIAKERRMDGWTFWGHAGLRKGDARHALSM